MADSEVWGTESFVAFSPALVTVDRHALTGVELALALGAVLVAVVLLLLFARARRRALSVHAARLGYLERLVDDNRSRFEQQGSVVHLDRERLVVVIEQRGTSTASRRVPRSTDE